jgi:hypothetical protein
LILVSRIALFVAICCSLAPAQDSNRQARWIEDRQAISKARQATDSKAYLAALLRLHADFPENTRVLRELMSAEEKAGNQKEALGFLSQYAAMGLTFKSDDKTSPSAAPEIDPKLVLNRAAVMTGARVLKVPDPQLVVEDIALSPQSRHFILTSVHRNKVIECDAAGKCVDIVVSTPESPLDAILAVHTDTRREILWITTAAMSVEDGYRPQNEGHSALLKFDLRSHRLISRYEPNDGEKHSLGDMTVSSSGDAYVSDSVSGDIYVVRQASDKLQRLVPHGIFISPQTPALNLDETLLYVPDYPGGIGIVHLQSGAVEWVQANRPAALAGIDGLYWTRNGLIAVQNGTEPERIVLFPLAAYDRIDGFRVIEANWRGLGDPTHGVVAGNDFYFIVNSGWDRVQEDGIVGEGPAAEVWKLSLSSLSSSARKK